MIDFEVRVRTRVCECLARESRRKNGMYHEEQEGRKRERGREREKGRSTVAETREHKMVKRHEHLCTTKEQKDDEIRRKGEQVVRTNQTKENEKRKKTQNKVEFKKTGVQTDDGGQRMSNKQEEDPSEQEGNNITKKDPAEE